MKKHMIIAVLILTIFAGGAWGSSFFEIEIASNVSPDTTFRIRNTAGTETGNLTLASGSSVGFYIGTEMALDYNLKLNIELGFHGGKYRIEEYTLFTEPLILQPVSDAMSYFNYIVLLGIRLKYDWQITDTISVEPYFIAGMTPLYMYSPSDRLQGILDADLGYDTSPSFSFVQSNNWGITYTGIGIDIDLTSASVEYSGSSKYLFGFAYRRIHRAVAFKENLKDIILRFFCITGTVLF